jgi:hypothetical protein
MVVAQLVQPPVVFVRSSLMPFGYLGSEYQARRFRRLFCCLKQAAVIANSFEEARAPHVGTTALAHTTPLSKHHTGL